MIGQTISHYKILEKLGEGGMGIVYKAQDTKLDRLVALKFLPPHLASDEQDKKRFIHEAKAASALDHPNICNIHEIDETPDGQVFIVMAIYEGTPLNKKIEKGPLKIDEALDVAIQAAEGLQAAHEKGIVHRDIKSGNIMLTDKDRAVIMDFGLARSQEVTKLTKTGATLGTVPYMSPEQARGEKVDQRTDIWSLGVVLYEMIAGRLPFQSAYSEAIVYSILNEEPPPLTSLRSDVPMELERIVKKAMQRDRTSRYKHTDELLTDLRSLKREIASGTERVAVSTRPSLKKRTFAFVSVGAFLAVVAVAVFIMFRPADEKIESIAVLPLENITRDPEQEYFADGMTEMLITELSKISALKVISRTSAMQYKGVKKPLPQIARELGVGALIEGSVLREGDQVRVTVQLIHGTTDRHLWAQTYQRELRGIMVLQSEVAQAIAREIKIKLTPQEQTLLATARPVNPAAHEAYLKGRFYWNKRSSDAMPTALQYFQQAVEMDPNYALAWSGIADCYIVSFGIYLGISPKDALAGAKSAVKKALQIDESLAEAQASLGSVEAAEWNWGAAQRSLQRALELNPGYATGHQWYAELLYITGKYDESIAEMNRALELDPLSLIMNSVLAWAYLASRDAENAIAQARRTLEMEPEFFDAIDCLAQALMMAGRPENEIFPVLVKRDSLLLSLSAKDSKALRDVAEAEGPKAYWQKRLTILLERAKREKGRELFLAECYAQLGEQQKAIGYVEKMYEQRDPVLSYVRIWVPLDPLRGEPRFQNLVRRMNFPKN